MENFIRKYAVLKNMVLLGVLVILFNIIMGYAFGRIEVDILDVQVYYSSEEAYNFISAYGEEGRARYINTTLLLDYIYPWFYSLLLSFIVFRLSGKYKLSLLPFAILTLDYAENTFVVILLASYPARLASLAAAAGIFTFTKWLMVWVCLAVIVWLGIKMAIETFQKRKNLSD